MRQCCHEGRDVPQGESGHVAPQPELTGFLPYLLRSKSWLSQPPGRSHPV